ncbi:MAG: DUF4878 domain-containing protein [Planctomycetes bacterium]|nr:DUF4878 domain-containing protein [Planctomycetota bacterium]
MKLLSALLISLAMLGAACGSTEPATAHDCAEAYFKAQVAFDVDRMIELTAEASREQARKQIEDQLKAKRDKIERMVITITGERVEGERTIISFHHITFFKDGKRAEYDAERQLVKEDGKWRVL